MKENLFRPQKMYRNRKLTEILLIMVCVYFLCGCGKVVAEPGEAEDTEEMECGRVLYPEWDQSAADPNTCFAIDTQALFFEPEDLLASLDLNHSMELNYADDNRMQYISAEQKDCFLNAYLEDGKKVVMDYSNTLGRMLVQIKNSRILQDETVEEKIKDRAIDSVREFLERLSDVCSGYILETCYYYNHKTIQDYLKGQLRELKQEEDPEEIEIQILKTQLQIVKNRKIAGYYMTFQAQADGRKVDSGIIQTGRGSIYKPPKITVCYIPEEGIAYVEIFHIRKPLEKTDRYASVSGEDALNYVKKMYNAYTVEDSGIKFDKMELNYVLLPAEKDEKRFQYVPAWIFYGTEYVYNSQGAFLFLQEKTVRINAVTGNEIF